MTDLETLEALQMPREGLWKWFAHLKRRCARHGGERLYADLLRLVKDCEATLEASEGGDRA